MPGIQKPYSKIAPFYDKMMDHIDYPRWARYIKSLITYYDAKVNTVVDLSCGTGSILPDLQDKNKKIKAGDISFSMLHQLKMKNTVPDVPLFCADFFNLPFKERQFDLVLVLYDSINYTLDDKRLQHFFEHAVAILKTKGLFIFDAVTPYICYDAFRDYHESHIIDGFGYERNGWFIEEENMQYNEFIVHEKGKAFYEMHKQKIRPVIEWREWIHQSPFSLLGALADFSFREAHKKSERVHFICRKDN